MDQKGDFPNETNDNSEEEYEENSSEDSDLDSEEENCSATALIDALADIPKQPQFQDLSSKDELPNDFLIKSFNNVSKNISVSKHFDSY